MVCPKHRPESIARNQQPLSGESQGESIARNQQIEMFQREPDAPERHTCAGNVDALLALVATGHRYGCILVDPPWPYANTATRGAAAKHYPTMSLADLGRLPVGQLALTRSHLHLWTTTSFLPDALHLLEVWGFPYKGVLTWEKPGLGLGNYYRNCTEYLLLGVRGNLRFQDRSVRNMYRGKRGKHSRKPDQVRVLIEKVSPAPRLELFGREAVDGWTVWGNDIAPTLFG